MIISIFDPCILYRKEHVHPKPQWHQIKKKYYFHGQFYFLAVVEKGEIKLLWNNSLYLLSFGPWSKIWSRSWGNVIWTTLQRVVFDLKLIHFTMKTLYNSSQKRLFEESTLSRINQLYPNTAYFIISVWRIIWITT